MTLVSELYSGGRYLKAADIKGRTYRVQVSHTAVEIPDEQKQKQKLVVYFTSATKPLVLNATNADCLARAWDDNPVSWPGRWLDLYTEPTQFEGKPVDGIVVRPVPENEAPKPATNGSDTAGLIVVPAAVDIPF